MPYGNSTAILKLLIISGIKVHLALGRVVNTWPEIGSPGARGYVIWRGRKSVPKLKSSKKRFAKSLTQRTRNRSHVSAVRTAVKTVQAGDPETAQQALKSAASVIDKAVRKGIIHSNRAARTKSRLSKLVARMA